MLRLRLSPFYTRIASYKRIVEHHFKQIGVRTNDAVSDDGMLNGSIGTDCHVRTNDGIFKTQPGPMLTGEL